MTEQTDSLSPDFLTAELQAHGLHFLVGRQRAPAIASLRPDALLAGLAQQQDARLRSALILLFLQQARFAEALPQALARLDAHDQTTLKVYYMAAVILQDEFSAELRRYLPNWRPLPDHHSHELGIDPEADNDVKLHQLGAFHARFTGLNVNWPGTYRHAAIRLVRRLKREAQWAA